MAIYGFIFEFSDGTSLRTNGVDLPKPNVYFSAGGGGGGGTRDTSVSFTVGKEGGGITTGLKKLKRMNFSGVITSATMSANASGAMVIDILKSTYPTIPSSSICASAKPTLSGTQVSIDTTLTGWTVNFSAGDFLGFSVVSNDGLLEWCSLDLGIRETR